MKRKWIEVKIVTDEYRGEHVNWVVIHEVHTIKVDEDCDNLRDECLKELKHLGIKCIRIERYKFI